MPPKSRRVKYRERGGAFTLNMHVQAHTATEHTSSLHSIHQRCNTYKKWMALSPFDWIKTCSHRQRRLHFLQHYKTQKQDCILLNKWNQCDVLTSPSGQTLGESPNGVQDFRSCGTQESPTPKKALSQYFSSPEILSCSQQAPMLPLSHSTCNLASSPSFTCDKIRAASSLWSVAVPVPGPPTSSPACMGL